MVTELGSMAPPTPGARRSTRNSRGTGGRDVQLDKLGTMLVAPTRPPKKCFTPCDGLLLPANALTPVQKKARRSKKV